MAQQNRQTNLREAQSKNAPRILRVVKRKLRSTFPHLREEKDRRNRLGGYEFGKDGVHYSLSHWVGCWRLRLVILGPPGSFNRQLINYLVAEKERDVSLLNAKDFVWQQNSRTCIIEISHQSVVGDYSDFMAWEETVPFFRTALGRLESAFRPLIMSFDGHEE